MYKKIDGGSEFVVGEGSLAITMHLPPQGMVWNYDKGELEPCEVIQRSIIKSEQYWERPLPPNDFEKKSRREAAIQENDPDYVDPELQAYRAREWHRRKYGVWFMNNGRMTYLTGLYYFYLTHWRIDVGYPDFRLQDLKKAYFLQYCTEDPNCYGMVEITKRRAGKTYFGGCFLTEFSTRRKNSNSGLQSKTERDAKSVFSRAIVQPFRKLPDFFKPEYDKSQGDVPKRELRFYKTSKKGSVADKDYQQGVELESMVDYRNSKPEAYDGEKILAYLCDEVFKTVDVDILERHRIVKPCLEDSSGRIIGKALYTSTVEEMEGYFDDYKQLWIDSDHSKKGASGQTKSGLYRFFSSAQSYMYIDKYGIPDEKQALHDIMQRRLELADDPKALSSYIRKNPTTWEEAFRVDGDNCIYNETKLNERLDTLNWKKNNYKSYDLIWNEDKTHVTLSESRSGRFKFAWTFEDAGMPDSANMVSNRGSQKYPLNNLKFVIGIDPFDHDRTKNGKFSNGAAAVYYKHDPMNPEESDNFVCVYVARPQTAYMFFEDMIKLCHYFGCQMLFEDQKQGIKNYFKDRGYGAFLMRDDKGNEGISASQKTTQSIAEHTEYFIDNNYKKINFPELIEDWLQFNLADTEKFDLAMASGYALIADSRIKRRSEFIKRKSTTVGLDKYIRRHKLRRKNGISISKSFNRP